MRILLAASLVMTATAVAPVRAHAAVPRAARDDGSVAIRLVNDAGSPTGGLDDVYVVAQRAPGRMLTRHVAVTNGSRRTVSVRVYAGGAALDGATFAPLPAGVSNELVGWTSVSPSIVTLAPGATRTATVSITVPDDARHGYRYGVVWAEVRDPGRGHVTLVSRVGVRVYLSTGVPSGVGERFTLDAPHARRGADDRFTLTTRVRNVGDVPLRVRGSVVMAHGPGGVRAGPFEVVAPDVIRPGDDSIARVVLPRHIPLGRWRADVAIRSAGVTRHAVADVELRTRGHDGGVDPTAVVAAIVAFVVLAAAGTNAARRYAGRRARTRRARTTVLASGRRARRRRSGSRRARRHRSRARGSDARL